MTNPVHIRGVDYRSGSEAARALGITKQAVYNALEQGKTDTVGLYPTKTTPRPVCINDIWYPSMRNAEYITGIALSTIQGRVISGLYKVTS